MVIDGRVPFIETIQLYTIVDLTQIELCFLFLNAADNPTCMLKQAKGGKYVVTGAVTVFYPGVNKK